ncbi:MAG: ORC1-type DNA replication protein [Candidatus Diapherotrites archaeon ADurb.Bin253]|mgnify:CR=1 FL=1|jgi:cell division control protein 6|nr:orc1/cdc6 family replication initiation protein [Candidatus Pacearchaeota archaeon]OQA69128.1 MAG: ORC1-type DNA replication protein [Candidatus Diapherotrites archaeon ADurb.Bin253]HNZ52125.1 orc1/cdc6 family replication initiation protein [Candidatus Pacearchaeota archaeon]HOC96671.1 orc1/cdc6 family replication initiation protein [Candidatus Pacearchaeota archaeon]HOF44475.1 orc1/cdc6 family replication initiation protein [Candidatus Pacearchaeota archaeon]
MKLDIDKIFDSFDKNNIFKDKTILQSNYSPSEIPHREEQIKQIASILAPVLRGEKTSNLFLYGKTGTGKTLAMRFVQEELYKRVKKDADFKLKIEYLNCKMKKVSDTEYRILAELVKKMGGDVPLTGLPTQAIYNKFIETIDSEKNLVVLILDEIDQTVKKISSDFLYSLVRLNSELSKSQICLVGISNDLRFLEELDPRVRSSLSEEEILFHPYNALQIQDILNQRAELAFKEGVLQEGVINKCAALAAKEHGDARRALDLLRVAGELAERDNSKKILLKYIDNANEKIEKDKILETISSEPKQFQLVLGSIIYLLEHQKNDLPVFTGEVYDFYQQLCLKNRLEILTQRRVGEIIQELDMLGIINVRVISKGRGGRMREIKMAISKEITNKAKEIIENSLNYV